MQGFSGGEMGLKMKERLKELCCSVGVAGDEFAVSTIAARMLEECGAEVTIDGFGSVVGYINKDKTDLPLMLLDAHIDEIGMMVTYIDDNGFIKVSNCGGMDRRILSAQEVTVHGKQDILGVIGSKPPHLEKADEAKKVSPIEELFIDIGMSKEKAESIVSLGDRVTINSEYRELLNGRIAVKSLDDRSGVVSILQALLYLKGKDLPYRIAVLFSVQEEVGAAGARVSSYSIDPDVAIAVDVSFAYTSDAIEHKCGKMGKGAMIGYSPILNKGMSDKLVKLAKDKGISHQVEVMSGRTSTNADQISINRGGVKTALLSIPIRYMHTPIECVLPEDIDSVAKLISEYILAGGDR